MTMENEANSTAVPVAPINPHVLWRQILGLVFWVGVLPFFCGGLLGSMLCLLLGGLTFADAWTSGIYKLPNKRSLSNISPMGWGIIMAMLLVVGYPMYLINRKKLRTVAGPNVFYWAVIVLGGLILAFGMLGAVAHFTTPRT